MKCYIVNVVEIGYGLLEIEEGFHCCLVVKSNMFLYNPVWSNAVIIHPRSL